ncbi:hypothetical protein ACFLYL_00340 [Chloroflexota bacterium]
MLDYQKCIIDGNGYQGNGNGYDHLDGDWLTYYKIARGFVKRVKPEDREDFLHDLLVVMAKVKAKYQVIGKPLTEAGLIRVAAYEVAEYWRRWFKRTNGIDCSHCSQTQKRKCREENLYRQCHKAIRMESLDRVIEDGNGDATALHELIADDNVVDVAARLDARLTLQGYPHKFVRIAYKQYAGYPLTNSERAYLYRHRRKVQKRLILA